VGEKASSTSGVAESLEGELKISLTIQSGEVAEIALVELEIWLLSMAETANVPAVEVPL
jgi:hypothetical protein